MERRMAIDRCRGDGQAPASKVTPSHFFATDPDAALVGRSPLRPAGYVDPAADGRDGLRTNVYTQAAFEADGIHALREGAQ